MAKDIPLAFEINLQPEGLVFEVGSLFEGFCSLHDQRDARGVRYPLVTILLFVLLAKLAGESGLRGIAQWVRHRAALLADFFALAHPQAPHATTYSRILGKALPLEEFQAVVRDFFARTPLGDRRSTSPWTGKPSGAPFRRDAVTGCICWPPTCPKPAGCWPKSPWGGRRMKSRPPPAC